MKHILPTIICLLFFWPKESVAQQTSTFQPIQKKSSIWQGTMSLERVESYLLSSFNQDTGLPEYGSQITNYLRIDVQYIRMMSNPVGIGFKTTANIIASAGGFGANGIAIGPLARVNFYQNTKLLLYSEAFYQYTRDLDAGLLGEVFNNGTNRFRTGFVVGASTRISNRAGIFLRAQRIWERDAGDDVLSSDAINASLLVGIELFTFN